jgi:hypothetical protein
MKNQIYEIQLRRLLVQASTLRLSASVFVFPLSFDTVRPLYLFLHLLIKNVAGLPQQLEMDQKLK